MQERPDAELTGREAPEYGRRYEIFCNEYSVGNLQIFASHHYGPADPQVGTEIELQYARLLPFGEINRFISAIANFTASGNAEEAQRVKNTIHETMLNELWQHEFDPDLDRRNSGGSIELRFDGSAAAFLRTSTDRNVFRRGISWAEELGYAKSVKLLQQTLDQERATDAALTKLAKAVINLDAEKDETA